MLVRMNGSPMTPNPGGEPTAPNCTVAPDMDHGAGPRTIIGAKGCRTGGIESASIDQGESRIAVVPGEYQGSRTVFRDRGRRTCRAVRRFPPLIEPLMVRAGRR